MTNEKPHRIVADAAGAIVVDQFLDQQVTASPPTFQSHATAGRPTATLRPHQVDLIQNIKAAISDRCRRIIGQGATGFGKTKVAAAITTAAIERRKRVIFTVPAVSLVDQTIEKFWAEGIRDIGVIQANHWLTDYSKPVQIASIQTLQRRCKAGDELSLIPAADLVLIDEVHRWFDFYGEWLGAPSMADVPVIGLTATPWTRGLGRYFDKLIIGATTGELIDAGYLSKFRVFAPNSPDLSNVRTVAGDYREDDLGKVMNKDSLVADVVDTWIERAENRPTLCFAVDRVHAKHLETKFQAAGITAGYIDAYTSSAERKRIAEAFQRGRIKVVCNVGCLTTGIDWDVRAIILARPTKSEMLFVQMIGRGLRTADGKTDCLILDHSDNHTRLGFVTDIHHDELDDGKPKTKAEPKKSEALPKKCPQCMFLKPAKMLVCPCCGFRPEPKCTIVNRDGELIELTDRRTVKAIAQAQDKIRLYQEIKWIAVNRGYKSGWTAHQFKTKFGHWPNGLGTCRPFLRHRPRGHGSNRGRLRSRKHRVTSDDGASVGASQRTLAIDPPCHRD
jgi:superfamily II DNA or RNA helicase